MSTTIKMEISTSVEHVVQDTTERDSLTAKRGDSVRVLSLSQVQVYTGVSWQTTKTGNPARLADLNNAFSIIELFVHSTLGNDETGNGTLCLPYATYQRAFDEIPRGAYGYVIIKTLDAGSQQLISTKFFEHAGGAAGINVIVLSYLDVVEAATLNGANSQISLGADHYVSTTLCSTDTMFSASINENEHWLYQGLDFSGVDFPTAYQLVGTVAGTSTHESDGTNKKLAVLSSLVAAPPLGTYDICKFGTSITADPNDVLGNIELINTAYSRGLTLTYCGCTFDAQTITNSVNLNRCRITSGDLYAYGKSDIKLVNSGNGDVFCLSPLDTTIEVIGGSGNNLRIDPSSYRNESTGNQVLNLGPCLMRGNHADKIRLSNNQYGNINVINAYGLDFVDGTHRCMLIRNTTITFNGTDAFACDPSQLNVAQVGNGSRVKVNGGFYGVTAGVSWVLEEDCSISNVASLTALSSSLGDFTLGATAPQPYSAAPVGDATSLTRVS